MRSQVLVQGSCRTPLGSLHYSEAGSGYPILLLHGAGNSADLWRDVIPVLARAYRVIAVDFLGHGDSAAPVRQLTIPDHADTVRELLDTLAITQAVVCGTSLGGLVGLDLAARHSRYVTAIVANGTPGWHLESQRMARLTAVAAAADEEGRPIPELVLAANGAIAEGSDQLVRRQADLVKCGRWFMPTMWAVAAFDPIARLPRISCPTLVVIGASDYHMATSYVLSDGIRHSRTVVIPDAGHLTPYDDPLGIASAILSFLQVEVFPNGASREHGSGPWPDVNAPYSGSVLRSEET